jgi:predicted transcriptional regulator
MSEPRARRGRPNIVGIEKGMGPLEAQVLRVLARLAAPATVRQVCDALGREGYFAYQSILNCMNRLVRKGILERSKRGLTFLYRPLVDFEELTAEVVSNVLQHMGGELDRVVCRLLRIDPDVGAPELAALRRRVRAIAKKGKER